MVIGKPKRPKTGGRKPSYSEPTTTFTTRSPTSHIPKIKELIRDYLNGIKDQPQPTN